MRTYKNLLSIYSVLLLLFISLPAFSLQTNFRFHEYNKQNKLNQELVKSICQDSMGIYYLATDGGVFSLINDNFIPFRLPEGKSHYFKELLKLKNNKILAVSDDAIYQITPSFEKSKMELLIECNLDPAAPKYPKHIYQDSKGMIWIADYNNIFRYNGNTIEKYEMGKKNLTSSYARSFQFMECDNGNLIVVSQKGLFYYYNSAKNSFSPITSRQDFLVHSSFKLGGNDFLIGTSKGVLKVSFDEDANLIKSDLILKDIIVSSFEQLADNSILAGTWFQGLLEIDMDQDYKIYPVSGFPYFTVNAIFRDEFGKYWVATNSGAVVMEEKFFSSQFLTANSDYVASIADDKSGQVYFAGRNRIYKISNHNNIETEAISFEGSANVLKFYGDIMLIGTESGNLEVYENNVLLTSVKISDLAITAIEVISEEEAWVVANKELFRVNLIDGTFKSYLNQFRGKRLVQDICLTGNKNLYIGGEGKSAYLFFYNRKDDKITNLSRNFKFELTGDVWIRDMKLDDDILYLGSSVGLFQLEDSTITRVNLDDMSDNEINGIAIDQFDALWLTSSRGVIRKRKNDVSLFTPDQGLPSKTFTTKNLLIDKNGYLWVGTSNGLAYAHVSDSIPSTPKPIVHLAKEVTQYIKPDTSLVITANSMLLMDVTATIYPQKQNQFQFCIQKDKDRITEWKGLSSKNQILVSDLDPGSYKICIRCKHEGNYAWSDHRIVPLHVNQVWYLQWYTFLFEVFLVLLLVYATSRYSKKRAQKYLMELEKLVSERTIQLQDANVNLFSANKAKDRFLSIIAHDLKNPFNAIRGFSKLLVQDEDFLTEEEKKEMIETIYKSSDDTFKLLENLLEWANVQKGNFKLNREEFDLEEVMANNLDLHKSLASLKEVNVVGHFESVKVNADKAMVDTVIRNLMSNAIKFSFAGKEIDLRAKQEDGFVVIQVKDQGVGMTAEQMDKLFKIDTVFTSEGTANETGTGFGLMLCKEFVELNGGKIWVESVKDKGSRFFFSIPHSIAV
ncbi:sensor histidine kinase [Ancylomarina longa]|uniref:histidine kinase n=1 Tax=Ancylomarina longa TaxID=2487017 RepID=A0A434AZU8_9BACT|nr:ATP-binding protein [Ancylomarina longa]RUT79987.1 hypothetical protein DLK05_01130 [Ancylomarina longa]